MNASTSAAQRAIDRRPTGTASDARAESAVSASTYPVPPGFLWLADVLMQSGALFLAWRMSPLTQSLWAAERADDFLERRGQVGEVQRGQSRTSFREQRHVHVAVGTKARGEGRAHQTGRDQPLVGSKDIRDLADGVFGEWHRRVGHPG